MIYFATGIAREMELEKRTDRKDEDHLRLAIRNGYLNFYRRGQSVAKVGFDRAGNLQAKIHNKYVCGAEGSGQSHITLTSAGYP